MVLNLDCFKDTLHFINENLIIDNETNETTPLDVVEIYKADRLTQYSKADIYLALCYLSDVKYIDLKFNQMNHKRMLFHVNAVTMEGQNFYFGTLESSTWNALKEKAQTLGGIALKFIGDTVQKCAVTATATAATVITNKLIDGQ